MSSVDFFICEVCVKVKVFEINICCVKYLFNNVVNVLGCRFKGRFWKWMRREDDID